MRAKILVLMASSALAFSVACGDSETDDGTGGSGNTGNTTSTGGNGTGGDSAGGSTGAQCLVGGEARAMPGDCQTACELLFCCAESECAPISASDEAAFVPGCVETCMGMMSTIAVVNGEDCAGTVSIVSSASTTFADTCMNGIPGTGGGGGMGGGTGGSAGGAGGAGGSGGS